MSRSSPLARLLVVSALALAGCKDEPPPPGPTPPPPTPPASPPSTSPLERIPHPDTLEALAREFQTAQKAKDPKRLGQLGASVVPSESEWKALVRPGPDADAFLAQPKTTGFSPDSEEAKALGALFAPGGPERTEILVHRATTEEIAAYEKGSLAFEEFPGGMQRFAQQVAAPGLTWWVVECVEPGSSTGMKYSVFTRHGNRWLFVPKPWRMMPNDSEGK
jgi:hypothetical protein